MRCQVLSPVPRGFVPDPMPFACTTFVSKCLENFRFGTIFNHDFSFIVKIVAALSRTIDEQSEEEMPEEEKHHESFGNANRFRRFQ